MANAAAEDQDSISRQKVPHAAFVNSIKKLNRDRINPAAVSQTLTTEEAVAQETV